MAILNSDHLFEQADRLVTQPGRAPRQVDLRRAISSAYYGVFHATLAAAADQFVGKGKRITSQYSLVYRSVDHRGFQKLCMGLKDQKFSRKYAPHVPPGGFGPDLQPFAAAALELQEKRISADYDPSIWVRSSDAVLAVNTARTALRRFEAASALSREAFLTLLLFQPR